MILVRSQPLRHADQARIVGAVGSDEAGLVVRVELRIEGLFDNGWIAADAFIDTGADQSAISIRWLHHHSPATKPSVTASADGEWLLRGRKTIRIGGAELPVPAIAALGVVDQCGYWGTHHPWGLSDPGDPFDWHEDLLIGRDVLDHHGLMLVYCGHSRTFSLLYPSDSGNRARRDRVLAALSDPAE